MKEKTKRGHPLYRIKRLAPSGRATTGACSRFTAAVEAPLKAVHRAVARDFGPVPSPPPPPPGFPVKPWVELDSLAKYQLPDPFNPMFLPMQITIPPLTRIFAAPFELVGLTGFGDPAVADPEGVMWVGVAEGVSVAGRGIRIRSPRRVFATIEIPGLYDFSWSTLVDRPQQYFSAGIGTSVFAGSKTKPILQRWADLFVVSNPGQFANGKGSGSLDQLVAVSGGPFAQPLQPISMTLEAKVEYDFWISLASVGVGVTNRLPLAFLRCRVPLILMTVWDPVPQPK